MTSCARTMTVTTPQELWREVPIPIYLKMGLSNVFLRFRLANPSSMRSHSTISSPFYPPNSQTSLNLPLTTVQSLDLQSKVLWMEVESVVANPFSPSFLACQSAIIWSPQHHLSLLLLLYLFFKSLMRSKNAVTPSRVFILFLKILSLQFLAFQLYLSMNSRGLLLTWLIRWKVFSIFLSKSIQQQTIKYQFTQLQIHIHLRNKLRKVS